MAVVESAFAPDTLGRYRNRPDKIVGVTDPYAELNAVERDILSAIVKAARKTNIKAGFHSIGVELEDEDGDSDEKRESNQSSREKDNYSSHTSLEQQQYIDRHVHLEKNIIYETLKRLGYNVSLLKTSSTVIVRVSIDDITSVFMNHLNTVFPFLSDHEDIILLIINENIDLWSSDTSHQYFYKVFNLQEELCKAFVYIKSVLSNTFSVRGNVQCLIYI